ncbi:oocyte zinc finger protein XlCOF15-like [Pollicipes pollicipes]|uniref:oocyte zinc finger protein XlCOF15-like n=1 Tax=Pollicipes pollicipes TaxID=41117 RepID=UPI0018853840|nr:oocyte zinc finger protein XlCOF15-like [Pollicipes pollicipes]
MGPHPCAQCGKGFATKNYLSRHVLTHSGVVLGVVCDKRYLTSSHLADHMRTHSTSCDSLCDVCGKRFRHPKQLRVHAMLHKGLKPYACDQCSYSAAYLSGLLRHRQTHAAQRPHACPGMRALSDQLFAEAAAVVFDAADAGSMVLDERVPMVGVEMELNDQ